MKMTRRTQRETISLPKKQIVVVGIAGGVAYTKECPENISVVFVDYDDLEALGDVPEIPADVAGWLKTHEPQTLQKAQKSL